MSPRKLSRKKYGGADSVPETLADMRVKESLKECLRQAIAEERESMARYIDRAAPAKILRKKRPKSA